MPLRGILSRPSTNASVSSNEAFSTFEPTGLSSSQQLSKSPERGHRKIGSLQRLSLSFTPSSRDGAFHQFLSDEPGEMSHRNSLADVDGASGLRPWTSNGERTGMEQAGSSSVPMSKTTNEGLQHQEADPTPSPHRFSLMKFKHSSEPQLSTRYKETDTGGHEHPPPPTIITTAPTQPLNEEKPKKSKERFIPRTFSSFRKSMVIREEGPVRPNTLLSTHASDGNASSAPNLMRALSENNPWQHRQDTLLPPAYGDESNSSLALPAARMSESGGSEGSSGSHKLYAQTTTTHFIETTTTIFKLKRNKNKKSKDKGSLFPLPEKLPPPQSARTSISNVNDSGSTVGRRSMSPSRKSTHNVRWKSNLSVRNEPQYSPNASVTALTNAPLGSPGPAVTRKQSGLATNSGSNTPTGSLVPPRLGARGRSNTMGSIGRNSDRLGDATPSGRNSTSTVGRRSFGDILTQRLRKDSAPPRHGSGSGSIPGSKSNSFQLARDAEAELVYPPREEADTPASYLEKLEAAVPKGAMATILCKSPDDFSNVCLRKYMRGFSYFGESIDVSIRKMLMEVILPKETQQIDRLLQGFADRYHECNPGIFLTSDEANFVAFSILLLQSDNHNKNNKRKMTKQDYVKNTQNGKISVAEDVLDCFYDNVCYTPFIHFDDEVAASHHRLNAPKRRAGIRKTRSSEMLRGPVDPYTLILDNKLEILRPSLKEVIETEDSYSNVPVNSNDNHRSFVNAATLQIVSARSRPDAFTNEATITNPAEAQAGLVSIKIAKAGLLWRKSTKKKKAKSPWQEWGVVLTDAKLYFFKDIGWVKKLITQCEGHSRTSSRNMPLVFKPPVTSFVADAQMALDDAVALLDSNYKKHKNAFTFIKHGMVEEVFLANTEVDVVDWISKLNYAATFRTVGVRMRALLGNNYEGRNLYRNDSEVSTKTEGSISYDQPIPTSEKTNPQLAWEIMFYRRQLLSEKISTLDDHVATAQKELDYLLRNARHLLILLPIQQKSREGIVFAAGRMNAKLKWTRKEIWRAKTHRDILIKDLEAEAASAFPAPKALSSAATPLKTTPTRPAKSGLTRTDTDQTLRSNMTLSPAIATPLHEAETRRPSQAVLEHINTATSEAPEFASRRRKSGGSSHAISPNLSPHLGDDSIGHETIRTPSVRTQTSQHVPLAGDSHAAADADHDDTAVTEISLISVDGVTEKEKRRGSESEKEHRHNLPHLIDGGLKERAGSVRRSLQRTLRDTSNPLHMPNHSRSKKGKESGSSVAITDDGRSVMSGESEELRRDPTGRFVLHGKKASVITMGPEWQLSSEDRMKLREQMLREGSVAEAPEHTKASLHIDTTMIDAKRKSVDRAKSAQFDSISPRDATHTHNLERKETDAASKNRDRKSIADSNHWSVYSAVTSPITTPTGINETFHSAESSPRHSTDSEDERSEKYDVDEDESTLVKNKDDSRTVDEKIKEMVNV